MLHLKVSERILCPLLYDKGKYFKLPAPYEKLSRLPADALRVPIIAKKTLREYLHHTILRTNHVSESFSF
jgi:hypothetical protein